VLTKGNFFLLDAETGAAQKIAKDKILPLAQQTFRPLQPTGKTGRILGGNSLCEEKRNQSRHLQCKNFCF
jgi:hypothetical protein